MLRLRRPANRTRKTASLLPKPAVAKGLPKASAVTATAGEDAAGGADGHNKPHRRLRCLRRADRLVKRRKQSHLLT